MDSERVTIEVSQTPGASLRTLILYTEGKRRDTIVLRGKRACLCTKTDADVIRELAERGLCDGRKNLL